MLRVIPGSPLVFVFCLPVIGGKCFRTFFIYADQFHNRVVRAAVLQLQPYRI